MSEAVMSSTPKRAKSIGFWVLKIILALFFIGAAVAKLAGVPHMVHEFQLVGLGQWLRYVTALMEISGGVLLLWPGRTAFGAVILICVCVGAFFAQAFAIHEDVVHTIVIAAILAAIAWTHRGQISAG